MPRTSHWTGCAIEKAGLEIREKFYHHFGSGFPKSLNVSKAIDRLYGAERERIIVPTKKGNHPSQAGSVALGATGMTDISLPVSDDAKKWDGYGSATKPSTEEWFLIRNRERLKHSAKRFKMGRWRVEHRWLSGFI